jgi:hypothetical protein
MTDSRFILLILAFVGLFFAVSALLFMLISQRNKTEGPKTNMRLEAEMASNLQRWGIVLLIFNVLPFCLCLSPAATPELTAAILSSVVPSLVITYLFFNVRDASLFLTYSIMLIMWTILGVVSGDLFNIIIGALRLGWALIFMRLYYVYMEAQQAFAEERGMSMQALRTSIETDQRLRKATVYSGLVSGIGVGTMFAWSFISIFVHGSISLSIWVLSIEQFFILVGILALSLTVTLIVEKMDPAGYSTICGALGGMAVIVVISLSVLGRLATGIPQM